VACAGLAALAAAGAAGAGDDRAEAAPVVLREGFDSPSKWASRLSRSNDRTEAHAAIVSAPGRPGRALRVTYPAGEFGGRAGVQFALRLRPRDDLHLRYRVRFDRRFDFVRAGKLPGLAGGDANSGGDIPDGRDGWSGRLQWLGGGGIENYMYLPTSDDFGTHFVWRRARLSRGDWNCLEMRYRLNRPGRSDGRIQSWLDGRPVLNRGGLRFRDTGALRIDQVFFSTFFGGNDDDYAPGRPQVAWFDDLAVSTGRIGCGR
jgi:hypothetical protein